MIGAISKTMTKVFGSRNERLVKSYYKRVEQINELEPEIRRLTDAQLREKTETFRGRIRGGEKADQLLPEVMATAREIMDRAVGIRKIFDPSKKFDTSQLPGDMQNIYGKIAADIATREEEPVSGGDPAPPWMQVEIPIALYEAVRSIYPESRPPFRARPFDVQLIGGMVLGEGRIAEMKTGEGKTIVAPIACYMACIEELRCHVVTVNDYLVQRDRDWVFPFFYWAGLTVGAIHPHHMQPPQLKAEAYKCDVLYGTNSELGFDYLRDNMKLSTQDQVQKTRDFCIIDEVDSILIDEARTPLIISGPAHDDSPRYELADQLARHLMQRQREWDAANDVVVRCEMKIKGLEGDIRNARDKAMIAEMRDEMKRHLEELPSLEEKRDRHTQYYEIEMDKKASHLTHEGVSEAQKVANVGSFYVGNNMDMPHLLENALRSHAVYKRDKDYVVKDGEVIIVDENTGRLMVGRQWSDGLHQAVEAKEGVKIKQETQTLATVTLQNFFKLYKRLAGMTGTAITESTEFDEIYQLDVVCIPTNVPVIRNDRNDLIFLSGKDKWNAILDEIKEIHDVGRPVLVGTTSVEKSEMLAEMLHRKYGIQHEVLNAKQHERESHIVESAGALGAVMIATNMAGRGTDIRLQKISREDLVRHWQVRNLLPKQAKPEMSDGELIDLAYKHICAVTFGMKDRDADAMSGNEARLRMMRHWVVEHCYVKSEKAAAMAEEECLKLLDQVPEFLKHRLKMYSNIEEMGGLHIIGTERHESRRIDNQLRGRAGRQGDRGSSRFFISLEDDLMKMFAGKTTMTALSKLGMKEGDAIEHKWITKSVERAQRKVEERNFQTRKYLLEDDEVREYQRNDFYGTRQSVLEGKETEDMIFEYIEDAIRAAVSMYLRKGYVHEQIAEWCRQTLDVSIDPSRLTTDDLGELTERIRKDASDDVQQTVEMTLGEYMSNDTPPEDWDLKGLSAWAMSRYNVNLSINKLRQMNVDDVHNELISAAMAQVEKKEITGVEKFLEKFYAEKQLAAWVQQKFDIKMSPEELAVKDTIKANERIEHVVRFILEKAEERYHDREVRYPVDFIIELVFSAAQQNSEWAAEQLCGWAKQRYNIEWTPETIAKMSAQELHGILLKASEEWLRGGKLESAVDDALAKYRDQTNDLATWATERFGGELSADELDDEQTRRQVLIDHGRHVLRSELSRLERFVLLQILDQSWKEHLYAMDQVKDSTRLMSYAEKDPRIEFKRRGAEQFTVMKEQVRDRVTELIFRAKLSANVQVPRSVYRDQETRHDDADSATAGAGPNRGTEEQRRDMDAAERAGSGGDDSHLTRRQRRARAARQDEAAEPAAAPVGGNPRRKLKKRKRR